LLLEVLAGQRRQDERLASIETQQTLANQAWQRQGKLIEEVNQRCMGKLGMKCPLIEDPEEHGEENGDGEADRSGG
jgi:hypothetical protein